MILSRLRHNEPMPPTYAIAASPLSRYAMRITIGRFRHAIYYAAYCLILFYDDVLRFIFTYVKRHFFIITAFFDD